ncbi:MAG: cytochrome C [Acidobacteria bacterium]|nr:MAG: cytochrome C [Acidobacteriota bacterium]
MPGFLRGALLGFCGLVAGIQLIRPARTNPPVDQSHTLEAVVFVPPKIESILQRACDDCHSDLTRWPWYSNVAPVSWFVIDHVDSGRRHVNFSEWFRRDTKNPAEYTRERFQAMCRQMQTGDMPLTSYLLVHRTAKLSQDDIETICQWTKTGVLPN